MSDRPSTGLQPSAPERTRIWTIPNLLSFFRLLLYGPILYHVVRIERGWVLFWGLVGIATDNLDGYLARRLHQKSELGKMIDPLIDKMGVLAVTAYIAFSDAYALPSWYFFFLLLRELMVLLGGLWIRVRTGRFGESNRLGKRAAFVTGLAVLFFVMDWRPFAWILMAGSMALTLASTGVYAAFLIRTIRDGGRR